MKRMENSGRAQDWRALTSKNCGFIKGKVIILQYHGHSYGESTFEINPRLFNDLPELLKRYFKQTIKI
jgi:hypothetical protein